MFDKKENGTNYWMSYADLLTGLAIIFIIFSIVLGGKYKKAQNDINTKVEQNYDLISKIDSLNDIIRNLKEANKHVVGRIAKLEYRSNADKNQMEQIRILAETFSDLAERTDLFSYDKESQLFKLDVDVQFVEISENIPQANCKQLINAGKKLEEFIKGLHEKVNNVEFAIIIEGRAAKFLNKGDQNETYNAKYKDVNKRRSYGRALNLQKLWERNNIILTDLNYCDVLVVGNGFEGQGRFPYIPGQEEKNKNFVIKIIPKIKPLNN